MCAGGVDGVWMDFVDMMNAWMGLDDWSEWVSEKECSWRAAANLST